MKKENMETGYTYNTFIFEY